MPPKDSARPADWLAHAREDLLVARILLERGAAPHALGYHIQQAAEKALKCFLLARGKPVRRIHDLEELLDEATELAEGLEEHRSLCEVATAFAVVFRYPGVAAEPMDEDGLERLLKDAERLVDDVEEAIGP